jgi:hypothetical protein
MSVSSHRYSSPLKLTRARGERLVQGHSPKLARSVQFSSLAAFEYWISLEADPLVLDFCERPARAMINDREYVMDFWVQRNDDSQAFVTLAFDEDSDALPACGLGLPLRIVTLADRSAHAVWVGNWQRMLSVINATGTHSRQYVERVVQSVNAQTRLADIERAHAGIDVPTVRGAVFEALRTGLLVAPRLRFDPLTHLTVFEPNA